MIAIKASDLIFRGTQQPGHGAHRQQSNEPAPRPAGDNPGDTENHGGGMEHLPAHPRFNPEQEIREGQVGVDVERDVVLVRQRRTRPASSVQRRKRRLVRHQQDAESQHPPDLWQGPQANRQRQDEREQQDHAPRGLVCEEVVPGEGNVQGQERDECPHRAELAGPFDPQPRNGEEGGGQQDRHDRGRPDQPQARRARPAAVRSRRRGRPATGRTGTWVGQRPRCRSGTPLPWDARAFFDRDCGSAIAPEPRVSSGPVGMSIVSASRPNGQPRLVLAGSRPGRRLRLPRQSTAASPTIPSGWPRGTRT